MTWWLEHTGMDVGAGFFDAKFVLGNDVVRVVVRPKPFVGDLETWDAIMRKVCEGAVVLNFSTNDLKKYVEHGFLKAKLQAHYIFKDGNIETEVLP